VLVVACQQEKRTPWREGGVAKNTQAGAWIACHEEKRRLLEAQEIIFYLIE
jgi:hypothetical protein